MHCDLYIDGQREKAGRYLTVETPYDGTPVGEAPRATPEEVARAVAAAAKAKADAAERTAYQRYQWLSRAAAIVERDRDAFARTIAAESGKPLREARVEVDRGIQTLIFSAEEAKRVVGEMLPMDAHPVGRGRFGFTLRRPRGVVACITPFNFPLNLVCHKVGPALAAGNTVVLKPSEKTPLSAFKLADAFEEAGLPPGYLNVVGGLGTEVCGPLVTDPRVDMATFTGSAAVGAMLRAMVPLKAFTLELGGNSAVIIEPDADLSVAADRCRVGGFSNSGQVCIHLQRVYVHESRAGEFREMLAEKAGRLRVGPPLTDDAEVTGLITPAAAERVHSWVAEAVAGGAKALVGGGRTGRATVAPTVLADVPPDARLLREEVFGPVVAVAAYRTLDEAVAAVNATRYGLHAGIFTRDIDKALTAAERLEVGGVMINDVPTFRTDHMPYGGSKDSGTGREGPKYAIEEMTEVRAVVINRA
jgi:acyl-CoA reductase-like NAD-dependent aldehyde dehydrogenase